MIERYARPSALRVDFFKSAISLLTWCYTRITTTYSPKTCMRPGLDKKSLTRKIRTVTLLDRGSVISGMNQDFGSGELLIFHNAKYAYKVAT